MEYIVVYNNGQTAARHGAQREVPTAIDYPIVSRYEDYRVDQVPLNKWTAREWLRGFDSWKHHG